MTWSSYALKFGNEAEFLAAVLPGDPAVCAVDVIGTLFHAGTYDEEGVELTPPVPVPGYHVNLRLKVELPEALAPFVVEPALPKRVWA